MASDYIKDPIKGRKNTDQNKVLPSGHTRREFDATIEQAKKDAEKERKRDRSVFWKVFRWLNDHDFDIHLMVFGIRILEVVVFGGMIAGIVWLYWTVGSGVVNGLGWLTDFFRVIYSKN